MNRDLLRQAANVLALLVMLAVNWASNALPLNGRTAAEVSDSLPVLFVPAGYVFAIWGLIYLLLLAFTAYQALPAQRENTRLRGLGYTFAVSCLLNAAWLFAWHYGQLWLSLAIMVGLLATLIVIYRRLGIGRLPPPGRERWLVNLPFSVYLGWITVATVANAAGTLYAAGWNGGALGPLPWTLGMLLVGALLGLAAAVLRRDLAYVLVLAWAYLGIWVKQAPTPPVALTALALAALLAAVAAWLAWRGRAAGGGPLPTGA